jgi:hypothetical protein
MIDSKKYCYMTGTSILIWIVLFSAGLVVSSKPYLEQLKTSFSLGSFISASLVYTPCNVAILSVLAGFIGGSISKLIGPDEIQAKIDEANKSNNQSLIKNLERRKSYLTESPLLSMFRGFLTYLAIISGILLLISNPFEVTTSEQYVRIAGLVSGLSFLMGYDPTKFEELISKFSQWKPNNG